MEQRTQCFPCVEPKQLIHLTTQTDGHVETIDCLNYVSHPFPCVVQPRTDNKLSTWDADDMMQNCQAQLVILRVTKVELFFVITFSSPFLRVLRHFAVCLYNSS